MKKNNKEILCPISFISEEKIENTSDINSMFLMPYEMKLVNDINNATIISDMNIHDETSLKHLIQYNTIANTDSILGYMISNIYDITINNLLALINEISIEGNMQETAIDVNIPLDRDIIYKEILDAHNNFANQIDVLLNTQKFNRNYVYITLNTFMNTVFTVICSKVFDRFIVDLTAEIFFKGSANAVATEIATKIYGNDITEPMDSYAIYSFISSLFRSMAQSKLANLRGALIQIADTTTNMICNSLDWYACNDGMISPKQLLEGNKLFENMPEEFKGALVTPFTVIEEQK